MPDAFDLDDLGATEPEAKPDPALPLVPHPSRVRVHQNGMSIDLDMHALLNAIDPQGRWVGYDPEDDEDRFEPSSFAVAIADLTAQHLTKMMRKQIKDSIDQAVRDAVMAEVESIVRDALANGELQEVGEFGRVVGEPRPLTEIIVATAREALTKPTGDPYARGRQPTLVQKLVTDAVGAAFAKELQAEVDQARNAAKAAVRDSAAKVITDTIERASRGL